MFDSAGALSPDSVRLDGKSSCWLWAETDLRDKLSNNKDSADCYYSAIQRIVSYARGVERTVFLTSFFSFPKSGVWTGRTATYKHNRFFFSYDTQLHYTSQNCKYDAPPFVNALWVEFRPGVENDFGTFRQECFASVREGISGGKGEGMCVDMGTRENVSWLRFIIPSKE